MAAFPATLRDMPALEESKLERVEGEWPEIFDTLPALKTLRTERTALQAWPRTLDDLSKLQEIDFLDSQLASLDGLRSLPALQGLSIRGAPLDRLPDAAPHLPALKRLRLGGTKVSHLPPWVAELPALVAVGLPSTVPREEVAALKAKRPELYFSG